MFTTTITVIFGGATVTNFRERNPEFQRAVAERETAASEAVASEDPEPEEGA
jgi:hypothetical protein